MGLEQHKGQTTQDNRTAFEDESLRVKIENAKHALNKSFDTEKSNGTYEDQEDFQNQESFYKYSHCDEESLKIYGEILCWANFNTSMSIVGEENWCNMEMVVRSYNMLTECLELTSKSFMCYYPNVVVEQLFVRIHQHYFRFCSDEEDLPDAPAEVVLAATLLPILLIPFIVYIVVWKSSLRD
ncbi:receptor activity-modifying protein 2-like isoform X2 [Myxocyprinus asiaticus]|uniref:receptor activity-modifying protein 2-like isoform X2 n=1 Tax=Myxocyprinus asiaticus TaxID=70543 RepID=UPI0022236C4C|nr:receptor activity-modifying protein 2-like isoform X2 [Myxocyprinus asiaticus]